MIRDVPNVVMESFEPATTVVLVGKQPLTDADLDAWLFEFNRFNRRADAVRVVVFTDGGGPSNLLRKRMTDAVGADVKKIKNAILSDTATVRFVASTLSFFTDNVWSFSPREVNVALKELGYAEREQDAARRELARMARQVPTGRFHAFDLAVEHLGMARS